MNVALPIAATFLAVVAGAQDRQPSNSNSVKLACDRMALDAVARQRHFEVLGPALRSLHRRIRELPDGFEFEFPADAAVVHDVAEWAAGERLCCPFFDIDLRFPHDRGGFWLRLTGADGVKQFIRADFDRWFRN
jgi:hypothetical protein